MKMRFEKNKQTNTSRKKAKHKNNWKKSRSGVNRKSETLTVWKATKKVQESEREEKMARPEKEEERC